MEADSPTGHGSGEGSHSVAVRSIARTQRCQTEAREALSIGIHPVCASAGQTGRAKDVKRSKRMDWPSGQPTGAVLWAPPREDALPDDLLERVSAGR